ncbi:hypothetical protein IDG78_03075 [Pelagibacterales bacterium SAG-MED05]|nr:hypothetical protein [Pelagibacterales bacterium SAG-MED05]
MNRTILLFIFLISGFNSSISANELRCKNFDVKCKTKKFIEETKKYQKKGLEKSKEQIKDLNPLKK